MSPTVVGDWLYFVVARPETSQLRQLWKTDGTAAGTQMVTKRQPISSRGSDTVMVDLTAVNGALVYRNFNELWVSDGTDDGTEKIAEFRTRSNDPGISHLTSLGDVVVFSGDNGNDESGGQGVEPWVTDGTAAGTHILKDIVPAGAHVFLEGSKPHDFFVARGVLYFTARGAEDVSGQYLYKTDGTEAGTVLADLAPEGDAQYEFSHTSTLVAGDKLFIAYKVTEPAASGRPGDAVSHGWELCVNDGTPGGTRILEEILPGSSGGSLHHMIATSDTLFYAAHAQNNHERDHVQYALYALDFDDIE